MKVKRNLYNDKKVKSNKTIKQSFLGGLNDGFTHPDNVIKIVDYGSIAPDGRIADHWKHAKIVFNKSKFLHDRKSHTISNDKLSQYVNVEYICKTYGIRGLEFGNWMTEKDRIENIIGLGDCLERIVKTFNIKPFDVGKNILRIALGARGKGGKVAAHYERSYNVINITKPYADYGSFFHEYSHYVDNVLGSHFSNSHYRFSMLSGDNSRDTSISNELLTANFPYNSMEEVFECLYVDSNKPNTPTSFATNMIESTSYLASRVEVWARTCEVYFNLKGRPFNKMLGKYHHEAIKYPKEELVKLAMPNIDKLFNAYFKIKSKKVTK